VSFDAAAAGRALIWHDLECGSYDGDLDLWVELASQAGGPVLELGSGTGRVALELARAGVEVVALDRSALLLAELSRRAADAGVKIETVEADARSFALQRRLALIIAPMQFVQILGGPSERGAMLAAAATHLRPGGKLGVTLAEPEAEQSAVPPPPDVREVDRWVYSSLPVEIRDVPGGFELHRLRQLVSPAGKLTEELDVVRLDDLTAAAVIAEAQKVGLRPTDRREIPPTVRYVGSTVLLLEAE
jgi:SAM-dependent methyltransferase